MGRQVGVIARPLDLEEFMELVAGPICESVFDSEAEREAAWHYHHEQLMERRGSQAGDRPWGYWVYDLNVEEPATYLEKVLLLEKRGLLSKEERGEIISRAEHARRAPPCQAFVSPPGGEGVDEAKGAGAQRGSDRAPRGARGRDGECD